MDCLKFLPSFFLTTAAITAVVAAATATAFEDAVFSFEAKSCRQRRSLIYRERFCVSLSCDVHSYVQT